MVPATLWTKVYVANTGNGTGTGAAAGNPGMDAYAPTGKQWQYDVGTMDSIAYPPVAVLSFY